MINFRKISHLFLTLAILLWSPIAYAQGLIRDAEIERTLRIIADPLVKASGIGNINIFIINSNNPNAFATGGNSVFLSSGLIRRMRNVEMLQSVIAHEIAHLTGGHLAQRAANIGSTKTAAGLGVLLGILTAAAGGGGAGLGVAAATTSVGQRGFLAFSRAQESAADQAGARYMARAGINPSAALDVLKLFQGQQALNVNRQDAYSITHPLHSQRISDLKTVVAAYQTRPSTQSQNVHYWYARSVAKFNGFIGSPKSTLRKVSKSDKGEIATLTRAIAYHRLPNKKKSMVEIKRLLAMRPTDPYYQELYGQMLLENGNATAATAAYAKAVQRLPKDAQILAGLGRAQLAQNTTSSTQAALKTLKRAYARDSRNGRMLRDLGAAYAKTGNPGMASITTAERYALASNFKLAAVHAKRAERLLPQGSTGWRKAVDILNIAKRTSKGKK